MDPSVLGRTAVTFAFLVSSLGFLTWRQSRALEAHFRKNAEQGDIWIFGHTHEIQVLESRSRIVPEARELGLHSPGAAEQVILAVDGGA